MSPNAQTDKAGAAPAEAGEAEELEIPNLSLFGEFPDQVVVIPRTNATLLMSIGSIDEQKRSVVVPYIELIFAGFRQGTINQGKEEEELLEELFSQVVSLENAIWMLSDMASDIRAACLRLRTVVNPGALENVRLKLARDYAERLRQQAEFTVALLDEINKTSNIADVDPSSKAGRAGAGSNPGRQRSRKITQKSA